MAILREKSQGLVRGEERNKSLSSDQVLIDTINIFYLSNNSIRKTEIFSHNNFTQIYDFRVCSNIHSDPNRFICWYDMNLSMSKMPSNITYYLLSQKFFLSSKLHNQIRLAHSISFIW